MQSGTGILISRSAYQEDRRYVDVQPMGTINDKGTAEKIAVYEMLPAAPPPPDIRC